MITVNESVDHVGKSRKLGHGNLIGPGQRRDGGDFVLARIGTDSGRDAACEFFFSFFRLALRTKNLARESPIIALRMEVLPEPFQPSRAVRGLASTNKNVSGTCPLSLWRGGRQTDALRL